MIHAYDKLYLEVARTSLGRMLDFAVYELKYDLTEFFDLFIASGVAKRFGQGDCNILAGMSGIELAYLVLENTVAAYERVSPRCSAERSPEYWAGWALAYYQWYIGISFADIISLVPVADIRDLYWPYHEMDIRQFADRMNELCLQQKRETNLKRLRLSSGLTQKELAAKSGISVRTIQQFEQRQKNINNAQVNKLLPLSRVLYCEIEELLEPAGFIAAACKQPDSISL